MNNYSRCFAGAACPRRKPCFLSKTFWLAAIALAFGSGGGEGGGGTSENDSVGSAVLADGVANGGGREERGERSVSSSKRTGGLFSFLAPKAQANILFIPDYTPPPQNITLTYAGYEGILVGSDYTLLSNIIIGDNNVWISNDDYVDPIAPRTLTLSGDLSFSGNYTLHLSADGYGNPLTLRLAGGVSGISGDTSNAGKISLDTYPLSNGAGVNTLAFDNSSLLRVRATSITGKGTVEIAGTGAVELLSLSSDYTAANASSDALVYEVLANSILNVFTFAENPSWRKGDGGLAPNSYFHLLGGTLGLASSQEYFRTIVLEPETTSTIYTLPTNYKYNGPIGTAQGLTWMRGSITGGGNLIIDSNQTLGNPIGDTRDGTVILAGTVASGAVYDIGDITLADGRLQLGTDGYTVQVGVSYDNDVPAAFLGVRTPTTNTWVYNGDVTMPQGTILIFRQGGTSDYKQVFNGDVLLAARPDTASTDANQAATIAKKSESTLSFNGIVESTFLQLDEGRTEFHNTVETSFLEISYGPNYLATVTFDKPVTFVSHSEVDLAFANPYLAFWWGGTAEFIGDGTTQGQIVANAPFHIMTGIDSGSNLKPLGGVNEESIDVLRFSGTPVGERQQLVTGTAASTTTIRIKESAALKFDVGAGWNLEVSAPIYGVVENNGYYLPQGTVSDTYYYKRPRLIKSGAGNLILSGANTFQGGVLLSGGTLTIGSDSALGTWPAAGTTGTQSRSPGYVYVSTATKATVAIESSRVISNHFYMSKAQAGTRLALEIPKETSLVIQNVKTTGTDITNAGAAIFAVTETNTYVRNYADITAADFPSTYARNHPDSESEGFTPTDPLLYTTGGGDLVFFQNSTGFAGGAIAVYGTSNAAGIVLQNASFIGNGFTASSTNTDIRGGAIWLNTNTNYLLLEVTTGHTAVYLGNNERVGGVSIANSIYTKGKTVIEVHTDTNSTLKMFDPIRLDGTAHHAVWKDGYGEWQLAGENILTGAAVGGAGSKFLLQDGILTLLGSGTASETVNGTTVTANYSAASIDLGNYDEAYFEVGNPAHEDEIVLLRYAAAGVEKNIIYTRNLTFTASAGMAPVSTDGTINTLKVVLYDPPSAAPLPAASATSNVTTTNPAGPLLAPAAAPPAGVTFGGEFASGYVTLAPGDHPLISPPGAIGYMEFSVCGFGGYVLTGGGESVFAGRLNIGYIDIREGTATLATLDTAKGHVRTVFVRDAVVIKLHEAAFLRLDGIDTTDVTAALADIADRELIHDIVYMSVYSWYLNDLSDYYLVNDPAGVAELVPLLTVVEHGTDYRTGNPILYTILTPIPPPPRPTPEPSTYALFGAGLLAGLLWLRRRRQHKKN